MSENDYIAEYVRDRYPHILGIDFTFWKMGRCSGEAVEKVCDTLRGIDWEEIADGCDYRGEDNCAESDADD